MHLKNEAKFRAQVMTWLSGLTDKQFSEFFYEAVRGRKTCDGFGHFVLADAALMDGAWSVDLVALPDPDHYKQWADDVPICQSGECRVCKSSTRSWAKHGVCPVCGEQVYGT